MGYRPPTAPDQPQAPRKTYTPPTKKKKGKAYRPPTAPDQPQDAPTTTKKKKVSGDYRPPVAPGEVTQVITRPKAPSDVSAPSMKDFRSIDERLTQQSQRLAAERERAVASAAMVAEARARPPGVTEPKYTPTPAVTDEYIPTPYRPGTRPEEVEYGEPAARRRVEPQITKIHETIGEIIDVSAKRFKEGIAIAEGKEVKADITPVKEPEKYVTRDVFEYITEKTADYRRAIESAEAQRAIRAGIKAPTLLLPTPEIKERDPAVRFITGVLQAPAMVPDIAASLLLGAEHTIRTKGEVYKELPLAAGVMIGGIKQEVTVDPFRFAGEMVALPIISKVLPTVKTKPVEPTVKVKAKPVEPTIEIIPESIKKVDIAREAELRQMEALAEQRVIREAVPVERPVEIPAITELRKTREAELRQMEALAEQRVIREIEPVERPVEIPAITELRKPREAELRQMEALAEQRVIREAGPVEGPAERPVISELRKTREAELRQMEALAEQRVLYPEVYKVKEKTIKESISQLEDFAKMQVREPPKKYPIEPFEKYPVKPRVKIAVAERPPTKAKGLEELIDYETAKRLGIIDEPIPKRKIKGIEELIDYETAKRLGIITKPAKKRRYVAVPIPERVEKPRIEPVPSKRDVPTISIEPIDITKIIEGIKPIPTPRIEPVPRPYPEPKPYPEPRKYVAPPILKVEEIPPIPKKLKPTLDKKPKKVVGRVIKETPGYAWQLANPIASLEELLGVQKTTKRKSTRKKSTNRTKRRK